MCRKPVDTDIYVKKRAFAVLDGNLCQRVKRSGEKPHAEAGGRENEGGESSRVVIVAFVRMFFVAIAVVNIFYLRGGCNVGGLDVGLRGEVPSASVGD